LVHFISEYLQPFGRYFSAYWYILWPIGIFCGQLVYFVVIWYILLYILRPIGIFYGHLVYCGQLVYFTANWYIYGHLVYFMVNWYILWSTILLRGRGQLVYFTANRYIL
jgi:hypothetical protein